MFGVPVVKHGVNGELRQKGKIAELALGYGGSIGALKTMGATKLGLTDDELPPLVQMWRNASPHIVQFWRDVDKAAKDCIRQKGKIAELALGYGGSIGALKTMGATKLGLTDDELPPLVQMWRNASPHIVQFWRDVDKAAKDCIKTHLPQTTHGMKFVYHSGYTCFSVYGQDAIFATHSRKSVPIVLVLNPLISWELTQ